MRRHLLVLALVAPVVGVALYLYRPASVEPTAGKPLPPAAAPSPGSGPVTAEQALRRAALLIVQLEEAQPDMGGPSFKRRYDELLRDEEPLRLAYEAIKRERQPDQN